MASVAARAVCLRPHLLSAGGTTSGALQLRETRMGAASKENHGTHVVFCTVSAGESGPPPDKLPPSEQRISCGKKEI